MAKLINWLVKWLLTFLLCTRYREFNSDQIGKGLAFMELVVERGARPTCTCAYTQTHTWKPPYGFLHVSLIYSVSVLYCYLTAPPNNHYWLMILQFPNLVKASWSLPFTPELVFHRSKGMWLPLKAVISFNLRSVPFLWLHLGNNLTSKSIVIFSPGSQIKNKWYVYRQDLFKPCCCFGCL